MFAKCITIYDNTIEEICSEYVRAGAAGARTRRSLGHHLLHPLILRLLALCAPAVLQPRALQDAPAPQIQIPNAFPALIAPIDLQTQLS